MHIYVYKCVSNIFVYVCKRWIFEPSVHICTCVYIYIYMYIQGKTLFTPLSQAHPTMQNFRPSWGCRPLEAASCHLCVHVCVCVCVCVCVRMFVCVCVCVYLNTMNMYLKSHLANFSACMDSFHVCMYVCMYICLSSRFTSAAVQTHSHLQARFWSIFSCVCVCVSLCECMYACMYVRTYLYTYMYTTASSWPKTRLRTDQKTQAYEGTQNSPWPKQVVAHRRVRFQKFLHAEEQTCVRHHSKACKKRSRNQAIHAWLSMGTRMQITHTYRPVA